MATSDILQELTIYLRTLLVDGMVNLGVPGFLAGNITLDSPAETVANTVKLSLYLYHLQQNEHQNNEPALRIGNQQFRRPFYIDVAYLLTPMTKSATENLEIMGRCIQIFSANGTLNAPFLRLAREPSQGEARLRMLQYDLDAMNKLWSALAKSYRMSVAYEVSPVPVESVTPPKVGVPVEEAILDVQQMQGQR